MELPPDLLYPTLCHIYQYWYTYSHDTLVGIMQELVFIFKFFSANVHILGWGVVVISVLKVTWKASRFFDNIISSAGRLQQMESTVELLATNHLPHIQKELETVNTSVKELKDELIVEIRGLRNDLFQMAIRKD